MSGTALPATRLAYSLDELAVMSGCGRDSLYAAIREGRLIGRKLGRRTLISADEARRFISELPQLELSQTGKGRAKV
jgi:excisionase family DNA binding protein